LVTIRKLKAEIFFMMDFEDKIKLVREKAQAYVDIKKAEAFEAQIKAYEMQLERIKQNPSLMEPKSSSKMN